MTLLRLVREVLAMKKSRLDILSLTEKYDGFVEKHRKFLKKCEDLGSYGTVPSLYYDLASYYEKQAENTLKTLMSALDEKN